MIILYVLLGLLALAGLLVSVPVVLRVTFNGEQLKLKLRYLFVAYTVYPRGEEQPGRLRSYVDKVLSKLKEKQKKRKKKPSSGAARPPQPKKSTWQTLKEQRGFFGAIGYLWRIVRQSAGLGAYIVRHSVISRMKVHVIVSGEDAAETALEQGKWCAALYPALSLVLGSVKAYRNCSVNIAPDFVSGENKYDIDIKMRAKPFHGLVGAVRMLVSLVKAETADRQAEYSAQAFEKAAEGSRRDS